MAAAQKAVEAQNFAARKHVLEYDDVMNKQRQAVYGMRRALLEGQDQKQRVAEMTEGALGAFIDTRCPEKTHLSTWDWHGLETDILTQFGVKIPTDELMDMDRRLAEAEILDQLNKKYQEKENMLGVELLRETERMIMLNVIDNQWKDHLLSMDHLKEGIGLRGYGQKDPLVEYKKESFTLFQDMMDRIEDETIRYLYFLQRGEASAEFQQEQEVESETEAEQRHMEARAAQNSVLDFTRKIERKKEKELADLQFVGGESSRPKQPVLAKAKAGRNDPCPCGSGKKYKKCCAA
ncbi:MAG: SEC-C metal-binding domain-containing protein [Bryobacteraceae bacterium]